MDQKADTIQKGLIVWYLLFCERMVEFPFPVVKKGERYINMYFKIKRIASTYIRILIFLVFTFPVRRLITT